MKMNENINHPRYPDTHHSAYSKTIFGFWIYLLTDFVMFATFFACYVVLYKNTYGGPSAAQILNLPFALTQTFLLLACSFTSGLGGAAAHRRNKAQTLGFFAITFVFGLLFMALEYLEFSRILQSGNGWDKSAFLSSFFTLVGMHGLHMVFALLWIPVLLIPVILNEITPESIKRLTCLRMFWQFLNIVWIFIFTIVYLMGVK